VARRVVTQAVRSHSWRAERCSVGTRPGLDGACQVGTAADCGSGKTGSHAGRSGFFRRKAGHHKCFFQMDLQCQGRHWYGDDVMIGTAFALVAAAKAWPVPNEARQ